MLKIWQAIILGLVQGLTEFLPVSSSGHLVLLNKLFGIEENFIFLSILLHVATLIAVVVVLRREVLQLIKKPFSKQTKKLVVATIPTVILALLFKNFLKDSFGGALLPICFMITAALLLFADFFGRKREKCGEIEYKSALLMGVFQGFAMLPGISRSGATISAGMIMGEDKKETAKFSFLMSIPIIIASMLFEIVELIISGEGLALSVAPTAVAFVLAFLSGLFAIKFMLKIVQTKSYKWFSVYLVIIAIVSIFI